MSRVGKKPIPLPRQVTVTLQPGEVTVQGPKGVLSCPVPPELEVAVHDEQLTVSALAENNKVKARFGLTRALLANMVKGVHEGFERILEIQGIGYRQAKFIGPLPGFPVDGRHRISLPLRHVLGCLALEARADL